MGYDRTLVDTSDKSGAQKYTIHYNATSHALRNPVPGDFWEASVTEKGKSVLLKLEVLDVYPDIVVFRCGGDSLQMIISPNAKRLTEELLLQYMPVACSKSQFVNLVHYGPQGTKEPGPRALNEKRLFHGMYLQLVRRTLAPPTQLAENTPVARMYTPHDIADWLECTGAAGAAVRHDMLCAALPMALESAVAVPPKLLQSVDTVREFAEKYLGVVSWAVTTSPTSKIGVAKRHSVYAGGTGEAPPINGFAHGPNLPLCYLAAALRMTMPARPSKEYVAPPIEMDRKPGSLLQWKRSQDVL